MKTISIIEKLEKNHTASREELVFLLDGITADEREILRKAAQKRALESFGNRVYIRGLIEISSVCKNDCLYCGLRRSNPNAVRYRLTREQILSCCQLALTGYLKHWGRVFWTILPVFLLDGKYICLNCI